MEKIFDFDQIGDYLKKTFLIWCNAAVTGPYAKNIFIEMGLANHCIMNSIVKGLWGLHPDPNLTYAS